MNRLLLIPVLLLIVGCAPKRPTEPRNDPYAAPQLYVTPGLIRDSTAIQPPTATRDAESNILFVSVPIRSTVRRDLYIDYKVSFFDRNGQLISETGWFTRTLRGNEATDIQIRSTTPRAADFHVDIRDAR